MEWLQPRLMATSPCRVIYLPASGWFTLYLLNWTCVCTNMGPCARTYQYTCLPTPHNLFGFCLSTCTCNLSQPFNLIHLTVSSQTGGCHYLELGGLLVTYNRTGCHQFPVHSSNCHKNCRMDWLWMKPQAYYPCQVYGVNSVTHELFFPFPCTHRCCLIWLTLEWILKLH